MNLKNIRINLYNISRKIIDTKLKIWFKSPLFNLSIILLLVVATSVVVVPKTTWKKIFSGHMFATVFTPPAGPSNLDGVITAATTTGTTFASTGTSTFSFRVYAYKNTEYGKVYTTNYDSITYAEPSAVGTINSIPVAAGSGYSQNDILNIIDGTNTSATVKVDQVGGVLGSITRGQISSDTRGTGYASGTIVTLVGGDAQIRLDSVDGVPGAIATTSAIRVIPDSGGSSYAVGDIVSINQDGGTGAEAIVTAVDAPETGVVTGVEAISEYLGSGYIVDVATTTAITGTGTGLSIDIDNISVGAITGWSWISRGSGYSTGSAACNGDQGSGAVFQIDSVSDSNNGITALELLNGGTNYTIGTFPLSGGNGDATVQVTSIATSATPYDLTLNWNPTDGADGYKVVVENDSVNGYAGNYSYDVGTSTTPSFTYTGTGGTAGIPLINIDAIIGSTGGIDNDTKLMLHMGSDFTDSSASAHTITTVGSVQISTEQKKFGTGSGLFNGSTDYLTAPASEDFNFGSGDFTIDAWVYLNSMPTADDWPGTWYNHFVVAGFGYPGSYAGYDFVIGQNNLIFQNDDIQVVSGPHGMITNTWYHIAVTRSGNVFSLFVNGDRIGESNNSSPTDVGSGFSVGAETTGEGAFFNGYIDELRISKGIARWTSDFSSSLPTAPYNAGENQNITLTENTLVGNITINSGATLDLNGHTLSVGGDFVNNGTFTANGGTIKFIGNTTISGSSVNTFNNINITGELTAPAGNMNVTGIWSNSGTFNNNSGTVTFLGDGTDITPGSSEFYNLKFNPTLVSSEEILVVAGGGAGGGRHSGGGGGGGVIDIPSASLTDGSYDVVVGDGAPTVMDGSAGLNGQNSSFSAGRKTETALGGGGGGAYASRGYGATGGSGGGGAGTGDNPGGPGSQPVTNDFGTATGYASAGGMGKGECPNDFRNAGGGGGAGGAGGDGVCPIDEGWGTEANSAPSGGSGLSIMNSCFAGGGGGSQWTDGGVPGNGPGAGGCGAGAGGSADPSGAGTGNGTAGTPNTGGGGGGSGQFAYAGYSGQGGAGGSGIVIIRYLTDPSIVGIGGTITTDGAYTVHTFTSSGTFSITHTLAGTSGTYTLSHDVTSNNIIINADGTLNLAGHTLNVSGNFANNGGTLVSNGGTINFISGQHWWNFLDTGVSNLTVSYNSTSTDISSDGAISGGTVTLTRDEYVQNLTIANGATLNLAGHTLNVASWFVPNGTIISNGGTINFISGQHWWNFLDTGVSNLTVSYNSTSTDISSDGTISAGTVTLTRDEYVQNLTIASGATLDLAGHTLNIAGHWWNFVNNGTLTNDAGGSINFLTTGGDLTVAAGTTVNLTQDQSVNNISIAGPTFDIYGNQTVVGGTLNLNGYKLYVSGTYTLITTSADISNYPDNPEYCWYWGGPDYCGTHNVSGSGTLNPGGGTIQLASGHWWDFPNNDGTIQFISTSTDISSDATIAAGTNVTLSRDSYVHSLTIAGPTFDIYGNQTVVGGTLNLNGYKLYVSGTYSLPTASADISNYPDNPEYCWYWGGDYCGTHNVSGSGTLTDSVGGGKIILLPDLSTNNNTDVTIPTYFGMELSTNSYIRNLTIASGASLDLKGKTLNLTGNYTNNGGTLTDSVGGGTINYSGPWWLPVDVGSSGIILNHLSNSDEGSRSAIINTDIKLYRDAYIDNLTLASGGTIDLNGFALNFYGTYINTGGTLTINGGTINFLGHWWDIMNSGLDGLTVNYLPNNTDINSNVTIGSSIDNNTKLLLHMDTDFSDSSGYNHAVTPAGGATTTTDTFALGSGSGYFPPEGSNAGSLEIPNSSDFDFGSGDFTVEAMIKPERYDGYQIVAQSGITSGNFSWAFHASWDVSYISFSYSTDGYDSHAYSELRTAYAFNIDTWYHVAVTRTGGKMYFFVNGILINIGGTAFTPTIYSTTEGLLVGAGFDQNYGGYIDEVRITKGIARWTSDFTPPAAPYGAGPSLMTLSQNSSVHNITIAPGATLDLNGYSLTISGTYTNNGGTLTDGKGGGSINYAGPWWLPIDIGASSITVTYSANSTEVTSDLVLSTSTTLYRDAYIHNLTLATGGTLDLNGHTLNISGHWWNFKNTGGTLNKNGGAINYISQIPYPSDISSDATIDTSITLDRDQSVNNLTLTGGGTLDIGNHTLTVAGAYYNTGGTLTGNSGIMNVLGAHWWEQVSAPSGVTINYLGNNSTDGSTDATISTSTTLIKDSYVKNLTLATGGTLDLAGHTLNVAGNWINSGGTLTSGIGGTINLIGTSTQSIFGTNTFYNLTKNTSATSTLLFDSTATTTITNNLILNGTSGNLLTLNKSGGQLIPIDISANNPDFENWTGGTSFTNPSSDGTETANQWRLAWGGGAFPVVVSRESNLKTSGDYSFKVTTAASGVGAASWGQWAGSWGWDSSHIRQYIGKTLRLTGDVYSSVANKAGLWVTTSGNRNPNYHSSLVTQTNTWTPLSVDFTVPSDAATFQFGLTGNNPGNNEVYIVDNLKLYEIPAIGIGNPTFNIKYTGSGTVSLSHLNVASSTNLSSTPFLCTKCIDGGGNTNWTFTAPETLTSISILPLAPNVYVGATTTFYSMPLDQYSNLFATTTTWTSSRISVGTINSSTGLFTAVAIGTTTVTATAGNISTSTIVTVTRIPARLNSITISPRSSTVGLGSTIAFVATTLDQYGAAYNTTVTWTSSKASVGAVDSNGLFTAQASGATTITATAGDLSASTGVTVSSRSRRVSLVGVGGDTDTSTSLVDQIGKAISDLLNPKPKVLTPINTIEIPVNVPEALKLPELPTFGGTSTNSFSLVTPISAFVFAPLPEEISSILAKSTGLTEYLAAVGVSRVQDFVSLGRKPVLVSSTSTKVGLFNISNGTTTINSYITNDTDNKIIQIVHVASGTPLTISFVTTNKNSVVGTWSNRNISYVVNGNKATFKLIAPAQPGQYYLTTQSLPLPLVIEVLDIQPVVKPATWWSILLGWFGL